MSFDCRCIAADMPQSSNPDGIAREASALLARAKVTVSLAESCSGGLIAKLLTDTPGSSGYFTAGVVAYSNNAKLHFLDVPSELLERHGAVSAAVADAMARGVRRATGSDLALSTTGIAGPDGGTPEKPVGTVFLALADTKGCATRELRLSGSRDEIRIATACHALAWLVRHLSPDSMSSREHAP